jgi:hypothetical protein
LRCGRTDGDLINGGSAAIDEPDPASFGGAAIASMFSDRYIFRSTSHQEFSVVTDIFERD